MDLSLESQLHEIKFLHLEEDDPQKDADQVKLAQRAVG